MSSPPGGGGATAIGLCHVSVKGPGGVPVLTGGTVATMPCDHGPHPFAFTTLTRHVAEPVGTVSAHARSPGAGDVSVGHASPIPSRSTSAAVSPAPVADHTARIGRVVGCALAHVAHKIAASVIHRRITHQRVE